MLALLTVSKSRKDKAVNLLKPIDKAINFLMLYCLIKVQDSFRPFKNSSVKQVVFISAS